MSFKPDDATDVWTLLEQPHVVLCKLFTQLVEVILLECVSGLKFSVVKCSFGLPECYPAVSA